MSLPRGLTVVLRDGRTEWFGSAANATTGSYEEYDDGYRSSRDVDYLPFYVTHQVEADGSLVIIRVDRKLESYGPYVRESGRREIARFRPGLWDYVREE